MNLIFMVVLFIIGIIGLVKKRLTISKSKEISGGALKLISIFFILMAAERLLIGVDFWIFSLIILALILAMLYMSKPIGRHS